MENKKTTELINALAELPDSGEDIWGEGGKYEKLMGELETRHPFSDLLNPDFDDSLPAAWEAIKEIQADIKALKRHKHDAKSGDVMIRI
jgi:hypothetical protein